MWNFGIFDKDKFLTSCKLSNQIQAFGKAFFRERLEVADFVVVVCLFVRSGFLCNCSKLGGNIGKCFTFK